MMIQGTTGGVFTCVVTGDAVRCLSRLCPPSGAGTAAVSTPLSLCSSVDSSSAGAGASGHYSIVVLVLCCSCRPYPPPYYVVTDYNIDI